jgi:hypothetical protein
MKACRIARGYDRLEPSPAERDAPVAAIDGFEQRDGVGRAHFFQEADNVRRPRSDFSGSPSRGNASAREMAQLTQAERGSKGPGFRAVASSTEFFRGACRSGHCSFVALIEITGGRR